MSETGRLMIAMQGALEEAAPDPQKREELARYIRKGLKLSVKHAAHRLFINTNSDK